MNCNREQLLDYLYEELEPQAHRAVESHLEGCPDCRRELEALGGTTRLLRTWPDEESHLNLVFVAEEAEKGKHSLPAWLTIAPWRRWTVGLAGSLAALFLLLALVDFEFAYDSGRLDLAFNFAGNTPASVTDDLDQPLTRRDLLAAQQQSLELIQAMLQEGEIRQQRNLGLTLAQFSQQLERQEGEMRGKGQGAEAESKGYADTTNVLLRPGEWHLMLLPPMPPMPPMPPLPAVGGVEFDFNFQSAENVEQLTRKVEEIAERLRESGVISDSLAGRIRLEVKREIRSEEGEEETEEVLLPEEGDPSSSVVVVCAVQPDEHVIVELRFSPGFTSRSTPSRLILKARKEDIDAYQRGKIDLDKFRQKSELQEL